MSLTAQDGPGPFVEGANPGPSISAGLEHHPAAPSMANGYLRSLKVISENPLFSSTID
jgi:hypothetical protein